MYRIYVRWRQQRISDKTVTPSPQVAESAYRELMRRRDLWCTQSAAVLTLDGNQLEYRRFDTVRPIDESMAEKFSQGESFSGLARHLYPEDGDDTPAHPFISCFLDRTHQSCLILDDEPIRLS